MGFQSCPRLARPPPRWRLGIQPQVRQDLPDHGPLKDARDDLELPATAVRAVLHVDDDDRLSRYSLPSHLACNDAG